VPLCLNTTAEALLRHSGALRHSEALGDTLETRRCLKRAYSPLGLLSVAFFATRGCVRLNLGIAVATRCLGLCPVQHQGCGFSRSLQSSTLTTVPATDNFDHSGPRRELLSDLSSDKMRVQVPQSLLSNICDPSRRIAQHSLVEYYESWITGGRGNALVLWRLNQGNLEDASGSFVRPALLRRDKTILPSNFEVKTTFGGKSLLQMGDIVPSPRSI
jgi:hypothetical protein